MKPKRVAILGYSFRLPGSTREGFWGDLLAGKNLVTQVAPDRWALDAFWHPRKSHAGTAYTFAAGSIGDVAGFDAEFFGISPREAQQMDPQQRLLLEMSWEAMENAGIRPSSVRGTRTGVYIGVSTIDYSFRFADDLSAIDSGVATGTSSSITANRISYAFDLRGPSLAVDTACSSSLVAFHLACRSIASGESTLALAGGISLHMHPYGFVTFSKASMLSRRGICNVFDAAGDGYVRSEGGGVFVLKDYDQAVADGDPVAAVVVVTAMNSDGRKSGLTVPSVPAQAALLREAYAAAGIDPSEIDYLEAHGTGTAVGDPIETHALGEALGKLRARDNPLLIGSIKSNIGHLEAAAGVAGLVKALLSIEHRTVPATIHLSTPNPNIRFDEWNLKVAQEATPLKPEGRVVIGVNSFGFGGANAHVVLASPDPVRAAVPAARERTLLPAMITGRTSAALRAAARELAAFLRAEGTPDLHDVVHTLAFHREHHEHRAMVLADTAESLAASLETFASDTSAGHSVVTGAALPGNPGLAFVYTGNGAAWEGMGRRLFAEEPLFREVLQKVDAIFRRVGGYSVIEELLGNHGAGRYELTEVAQPALFALQVGITQVLRARGVRPAAVCGHSVGEVAAAWAAGALSLEQAVRVIYHRSRLQGETRGRGQMTAVAMGEAGVGELLSAAGLESVITVAGINSSRSVTLAGDPDALAAAEAAMTQRKIGFRRLALDYAFHSPAMDSVAGAIVSALAEIRPSATDTAFYSSVSGGLLSGENLGADYWWRNIREPVRFEGAIKHMLRDGARVFVEVGPHALLRGYVAHSLQDEALQGRIVPTLQRGDDQPLRLWQALFECGISGAAVDWTVLIRDGRFTPLPGYPWQRERYWHPLSPDSYQRLDRHLNHPLLGRRLHDADWAWEAHVDTQLCPSLAGHVIGDATVMPGTGYAEMALAAGQLWNAGETVEVEQLEIRAPMVLSDAQSKVVRFSIDAPDGTFSIRSRDQATAESWTHHATGRLLKEPRTGIRPPMVLPARAPDYTGADHNRITSSVGLAYGAAFRAIDSIWVEGGSAYATFRIPDEVRGELSKYHLHPALLDCTFQLIIQLLKDDYVAQAGLVYVPSKIEGLCWRAGRQAPVMARATLRRSSPHSITASFALCDAEGQPVAWIRRARFSSIRLHARPADRLRFLDYHYLPRPHPLATDSAPRRLFDRVHEKLGAFAHQGRNRATSRRYATEIEPLLDGLCCRYAARVLQSFSADGRLIAQTDIDARSRANPEAAPLIAALTGMLLEDKALTLSGTDYQLHPYEEAPSPEDIWNSLVSDYPDYLPVFNGVGRVGMHLADIVAGRRALADVLPRDCTPGELSHAVLADALSPMARAVQDLVAETLSHLSAGRRLRIMEFGSERTAFASSICGALDFNRCDYVFATFGGAAGEERVRLRERFPLVEIRDIDPENPDAAAVGGGEHVHLALVAADFATERQSYAALRYIRKQLAGGAVVLLVEHHPARWMDFLFGGRRSWWSAAPNGGWISMQRPPHLWRQQLQRLGFASTVTVELSERGDSGPYVLLSQQTDPVPPAKSPPAAARHWAVLADKEGFSSLLADQVARALEARGDRVSRIAPGAQLSRTGPGQFQLNPCDAGQFERLLPMIESESGPLDGVLHLYGLGFTEADGAPLLLLDRQVDRCASAAALLRACELANRKMACWIVTSRATRGEFHEADRGKAGPLSAESLDSALWGFGRTLMNESAHTTVRMLDIDEGIALDATTYALVREVSSPTPEQEVVFARTGDRYVPRLRVEPLPVAARETATRGAELVRLALPSPGQLRSLRWEAHPHVRPRGDEVEIEVQATGLNFRDVMYGLGLLSEEMFEEGFAGPTLGLEFAGTVASVGARVRDLVPGDRVVGFGPMSFANRVVTRIECVSRIPAGMPFAAAATIPSAFFTAHYSLSHLARLEEGESILIHGAAGGVGIAAIQIAKARGAEIFATAGSDEKRDFLRQLGADHVLDSRSLSFADDVLRLTAGRGVDVVLNSLAGEAINRNLQVLKPFGRFLELGKRDFQENTKIGLAPFRRNISYFGIDADQLMKERPELTARLFAEVMTLFGQGELHPLPYRCFDADDIVEAFRCMQQSRHIGKIVVTYGDGIRNVHHPERAKRNLELADDATYLVTGGLRGFGLRTAEWLAAKGARNLVLLSRSGRPDDDAAGVLAALDAKGVRVRAIACDVTDRGAVKALLSEIAVTMPPLRGIVHAATVIEDGLANRLSRDQIRKVFAPKILGAQHLHRMTLDRELDFFVMFSSATTLFGNPGQSSYVAANACLEALAASRRVQGLPALCVRWGAIGDAGYLARHVDIKDALLSRMGGSALSAAVALDTLEALLLADRSGIGVLEFDWKALSRFLPSAASPKFSELALGSDDGGAEDDGGEDVQRLIERLPPDELVAAFIGMLRKEVGQILRIAPEKVDESRVLYEMGFDSLMGVELSAAIETRFGVRLPVMALSESPTITKLAARILTLLTKAPGEPAGTAEEEVAESARLIAARHADEEYVESIARTAEDLKSGDGAEPSRMIR